MRRLIVDLDETLTLHGGPDYTNAIPNLPLIEKLHHYKKLGFEIAINTSRNMRTYGGNVGKINAHTLPVALDWLRRHGVPFDEIYVGKPWCGHDGFYIDDRSVRPSEFIGHSYDELLLLIAAERQGAP